jgi:acyl carrier protein
MTENDVKAFIIEQLTEKFNKIGFVEKHLLADFNLVQTGILDSMQFIELVSKIENKFEIEISLEDESPGYFVTLSGLARVAVKSSKNKH